MVVLFAYMCMQCKAIVHHRCNIRLVFFEELTASSKILKEGIPQNSLRIPGGAKKVSAQHFLFLVGVVRTSTPDANYFSLSVFSLFKNTFTFLSMVDGTVYDTIYHLQK